MAKDDPKQLLADFIGCLNARDWRGLSECLADDYVEDWPQTGERVRGVANVRRVIEGYPGGLEHGAIDTDRMDIVGAEDRYLLSPFMTVIRVEGSGDKYTLTYTATYPDGARWYVVMIARVTGGKIRNAHTYFAPVLPAPEWRRDAVELIGEEKT